MIPQASTRDGGLYCSRMDETEKYQQRLEAIAEKRRQQDEEERARREMEDEKLRLQQLKRKSLRDQWLMEGAPLSPASPDGQGPRSPPWGSHAHEAENHIDKLQSDSQHLEEEKKEQMEDGQVEAVEVAEAAAEMVQEVVVHNGEDNATALESTEDDVKINKSQRLDGTAVVLTNGGRDFNADIDHKASEQSIQSNTNGVLGAAEGDVSMKLEPVLSRCVSEADHVPDVNSNLEEEEGNLVMRAVCVMITDDGDDVPVDLGAEEDQQEAIQSDETPLPDQEAGKEDGETVEEIIKTETAPETFIQPEKSQATERTAEAKPETGDVDGDVKTNESVNGETKAEGMDKQSEDPPAIHLEGTTVASVPVYSEMQFVTVASEAEFEAAVSPEGAQGPATVSGQFQEVPLAEPQESQRTEAGLGEQEPLLSQAKAPDSQAEPAATNSPANTETHGPARASQGEEPEAPKRKTCQCCSVM
ncbi:paralemmin-3 isoform X2 [Scophthalmus maximus]|uniref:paralemmin-3 isoform X2 n=1 Tax=Scophthalmus maximus TaxID=52904 RepID=UPI0015E10982|nr:paralemmin-3 isoform X2 [Scophthalmus maximus]